MEVRLQPVKLYIAASVSSWNYSVGEGYGWVVLSLADLEGVPWVPWNPSFEELHGFENTQTYYIHIAPSAARDGNLLSL